ncbi:MAG: transporter substrate-binding domain-containing protein [Lachnospiraceae bacterium]|nr:transporter substrate-binding domain-containing protein [Lachnospiraceae bacterium]
MKKKLISLFAAVLGVMCLAGCGESKPAQTEPDANGGQTAASSDYDYIKNNGKMVIGITIYEPMNYYDENNNLTGFDTEFATDLCSRLGVTPSFQVIDWDMKETELKSKNIDCIWNGLTVTEERRANMDFTKTYLLNRQCVVVKSENVSKYKDKESLASAMMSAESGSAGESAIVDDPVLSAASYTASNSQQDALVALNAGNYDAIVIDYTMASSTVGKGDFSGLTVVDGIELANEEYAIGFRVGSDMTARVNDVITEMITDGTLAAIAQKYDMTDLYESAVK